MTLGIAILAFLFGFLCGMAVKVGRADREQDVEDYVRKLSERKKSTEHAPQGASGRPVY